MRSSIIILVLCALLTISIINAAKNKKKHSKWVDSWTDTGDNSEANPKPSM